MKPEIAVQLFSLLWQEYSARVSYARTYEQMITSAGGTVANDNIALRSLRLSLDSPNAQVNLGINYLEQVANALGYVASGEYVFPETHLYARHYSHPQQTEFDLPKLFISELIIDELPEEIAQLIDKTVSSFQPPLSLPLSNFLTKDGDVESIAQQLQKILATSPTFCSGRS
jgi:hypothetical protein